MSEFDTASEEKTIHQKIQTHNALFVCSAGYYGEFPKPVHDEYCILGRSNVGKSSFINHVLENRTLAKVSREPGKTQTANFFQVTGSMVWVDMPGYGYAKSVRREKGRMSLLIQDYCTKRENCRGIIWLVDIRHIGMQADIDVYEWLRKLGLPVFPVLTKGDKVSGSKRTEHAHHMKDLFRLSAPPVVYSMHKHESRAQFWKAFIDWATAVS